MYKTIISIFSIVIFISCNDIECNNTVTNKVNFPPRIVTICLDNHEYFYNDYANNMSIAIKLNDFGRPIKCVVKTDN